MSGSRPELESALCLSLPRLFQTGSLVPGRTTSGTLTWTRGTAEAIASISYDASLGEQDGILTLAYRVNGQEARDVIALSTVQNNYGGRSWYMHCPTTGRRARKLYKWSGLPQFRHREAVQPRPTYASQRDSGFSRATRQRWELRHRIGDKWSDLFSAPYRPKGMHRSTFFRHVLRDVELAKREHEALAGLLRRLPGLNLGAPDQLNDRV